MPLLFYSGLEEGSLQTIECQGFIAIHISRKELGQRVHVAPRVLNYESLLSKIRGIIGLG